MLNALIGKRRAEIWNYFTIDGKEKSLGVCNACNMRIRRGKTPADYSTTPLITHLRNKHPIEYKVYLEEKKKCASSSLERPSTAASTSSSTAPNNLMQMTLPENWDLLKKWQLNDEKANVIHQRIGEFLCTEHLPFSIVESPSFRKLISSLEPRYPHVSRKFIRDRVIPEISARVKAAIQSQLVEASWVSFTSDIWTASSNNDAFLSLTAHFISPLSFTRQRFALHILHAPGSHTGQNIANSFNKMLDNWCIPRHSVHLVITDDGANMKLGVELSHLFRRPCGAHLLHRVVQKAIMSQRTVSDLLVICRGIAGRFNHSSCATNKLHEIQRQLGLPEHKIFQDINTRWNSTFHSVHRILEQKKSLVIYATESDLKMPTQQQWALMEHLVHFLKPCEEITLQFSKENSTISCVIPGYVLLRRAIGNLSPTGSLQPTQAKMLECLDQLFQFTLTDPLYVTSTLLDPRFKNALIENVSALQEAKMQILSECDSQTEPLSSFKQLQPYSINSNDLWEGLHSAIQNLAILQPQNATKIGTAPLELERYLSAPFQDRNGDPLVWWQDNRLHYPLLAKLALKYLSAPPSSVSSERLFSVAGNVLSDNRNRLSPANAEMLILLHENLTALNFIY